MRLTRSIYIFDLNAIVISLVELRADGTVNPKDLELTDAEVVAYFSTPLSPDGFRATFVHAFIGAVQARYPAAQVTG